MRLEQIVHKIGNVIEKAVENPIVTSIATGVASAPVVYYVFDYNKQQTAVIAGASTFITYCSSQIIDGIIRKYKGLEMHTRAIESSIAGLFGGILFSLDAVYCWSDIIRECLANHSVNGSLFQNFKPREPMSNPGAIVAYGLLGGVGLKVIINSLYSLQTVTQSKWKSKT